MLKNSKIVGLRGAITIEDNTEESIKNNTISLLKNLVEENKINLKDISSVLFTLTKDIDAAYPALFARNELNWSNVPMMCTQEAFIKNSLPMCIRVLINLNAEETFEAKHVYMKEAKKLRPDL